MKNHPKKYDMYLKKTEEYFLVITWLPKRPIYGRNRNLTRSVRLLSLYFLPDRNLAAGRTYKWLVTVAETGFPGKPRISLDFSFHFKVAKVVGFPGFIQTRPKWIVASNSCKKYVVLNLGNCDIYGIHSSSLSQQGVQVSMPQVSSSKSRLRSKSSLRSKFRFRSRSKSE